MTGAVLLEPLMVGGLHLSFGFQPLLCLGGGGGEASVGGKNASFVFFEAPPFVGGFIQPPFIFKGMLLIHKTRCLFFHWRSYLALCVIRGASFFIGGLI
jgi:hypothetical protein